MVYDLRCIYKGNEPSFALETKVRNVSNNINRSLIGNILKSIFYHLRNAAAHADIERVAGNPIRYHIEHRYKGQLKLFCQMKKTDFWCFVDTAKNLKKKAVAKRK